MKKKIILFAINLLLANMVFACDCIKQRLLDRITQADFIAKVKVIGDVPGKSDENNYVVTIEVIDLYKGTIAKELWLNGRNTSCELHLPSNTTWLIFANKNKDGQIELGACSEPEQLNRIIDPVLHPNAQKNIQDEQNIKFGVLDFLKNRKIIPENPCKIAFNFFDHALSDLNGFKLTEKRFALYKIKINPDLTVKDVNAVTEFDNKKLSAGLIAAIKNKMKTNISFSKQKSIPSETEVYIGFYVYEMKDNRYGFVTMYNL